MESYETTGVVSKDIIKMPSEKHLRRGVAIIECIQEIPCNPCVDSCPSGAISMKDLNSTPEIDYDKCIGCGRCVSVCPGLAIFLVKIEGEHSFVTLPYEMLPMPKVGEIVKVLDREGKVVGNGEVVRVRVVNKTGIITVKVDRDLIMEVRNICPER
ncbi:MAG TPA: 4Fe-4S dicluster domain-containing protein [Thermoplasmatales archaeon]|nr:4Fe-4S dicluster domain-containing protein [Thermoplasmatales archaeon]